MVRLRGGVLWYLRLIFLEAWKSRHYVIHSFINGRVDIGLLCITCIDHDHLVSRLLWRLLPCTHVVFQTAAFLQKLLLIPTTGPIPLPMNWLLFNLFSYWNIILVPCRHQLLCPAQETCVASCHFDYGRCFRSFLSLIYSLVNHILLQKSPIYLILTPLFWWFLHWSGLLMPVVWIHWLILVQICQIFWLISTLCFIIDR